MVIGLSVFRKRFFTFLLVVWGCLSAYGAWGQKFYQCAEGETPDVKVWAAASAEEADVWVYFVYDGSELGGPGVIMQVPTRGEAEYSLSFVDVKEEADFSLWIVCVKEDAGWRDASKGQRFGKYIRDK